MLIKLRKQGDVWKRSCWLGIWKWQVHLPAVVSFDVWHPDVPGAAKLGTLSPICDGSWELGILACRQIQRLSVGWLTDHFFGYVWWQKLIFAWLAASPVKLQPDSAVCLPLTGQGWRCFDQIVQFFLVWLLKTQFITTVKPYKKSRKVKTLSLYIYSNTFLYYVFQTFQGQMTIARDW